MKTIYIVADSRGAALEGHIQPPPGYRVRVVNKGGATHQTALSIAKTVINEKPCELLFIMAGICSITQKVGNEISLPQETAEDIYQTTKDLLKATITDLDAYDSTPVIICQLTGVDLWAANQDSTHPNFQRYRKRGRRHAQQDSMDDAIIKLNKYIRLLNTERGFETLELAGAVHKHKGAEGWKHKYGQLWDGVHPNAATLKYWGKRMDENIGQFIQKQI